METINNKSYKIITPQIGESKTNFEKISNEFENRINKIVIYSVGLIGGSLGASFKQHGFKGEIVGVSYEKDLQSALFRKAIDKGFVYEEMNKAIKDCDLLFLCSPVKTIIETIKKLSEKVLPKGMIVCDVGSTKTEILKTAENLPEHIYFIGGHPMTGSERHGVEHADSFLFKNSKFVLSPNQNSMKISEEFSKFIEKYTGSKTIILDPSNHDKMTATISHLPHIIAVALMNFAEKIDNENKNTLKLVAGSFKQMTRVAMSPYSLWGDIFMKNKRENIDTLEQFIIELQNMLENLRNLSKNSSLENSFNNARKIRETLNKNQKGFECELFPISIIAKDEHGFLNKITSLISNENINIADFELLKIQEGEAGSIMFAFRKEDEAKKVIEILNKNGFQARKM